MKVQVVLVRVIRIAEMTPALPSASPITCRTSARIFIEPCRCRGDPRPRTAASPPIWRRWESAARYPRACVGRG